MQNPQFTLIIPVYNVAAYLKDCLDSALGQTFPSFEIICINDGSTDNSAAILVEYAAAHPQMQLITQSNKGLSAARNAGIQAAKGDYLFFLDSDDWIEPTTLQTLADKLTGEDLLCFNGRRYFEDGSEEIPDKGIVEVNLNGWDYYNKYALTARNFHFVCSVLRIYKRDFLLQHQLYFHEGIYHEDNLFTPVVCYYAQSVKVIPNCLYIYRIRKGSITQTVDIKRQYDTLIVANELSDFFIPINNIDKSVVYREIAGYYFKGFMPEQLKLYGNQKNVLKTLINWENYRTVSIYSRHLRIYRLVRIHPLLLRLYLRIEFLLKTIKEK